MTTAKITFQVPAQVARAYKAASEEDRRKMDLLVSFQLADFMHSPRSLEEVMSAMSREARQNRLAPEILQSVLDD